MTRFDCPSLAESSLFLALAGVDRAAALRAYFAYMGKNQSDVARASGVHHSVISRLLRHGVAGREVCGVLVSLGVPLELLPSHQDKDARAA